MRKAVALNLNSFIANVFFNQLFCFSGNSKSNAKPQSGNSPLLACRIINGFLHSGAAVGIFTSKSIKNSCDGRISCKAPIITSSFARMLSSTNAIDEYPDRLCIIFFQKPDIIPDRRTVFKKKFIEFFDEFSCEISACRTPKAL